MGIFDTPQEKERKRKLKDLEDRRLRFAQNLQQASLVPQSALLVSNDGGFVGVGKLPDGRWLYLTGPGPNEEEADFTYEIYDSLSVNAQEQMVPSEGMGGILGFGKKGGLGFVVTLCFEPDAIRTISFLSNLNTIWFSEMQKKKSRIGIPLFSTSRRKGDANVVWDFTLIEPSKVAARQEEILRYLGKR